MYVCVLYKYKCKLSYLSHLPIEAEVAATNIDETPDQKTPLLLILLSNLVHLRERDIFNPPIGFPMQIR